VACNSILLTGLPALIGAAMGICPPTHHPTSTTRCDCLTHLWVDSVGVLFLESHLGGLDKGPHQLPPSPRTPNSLSAEPALLIDSAPWLVT